MHFFFSSRRRHTRLQGDWSSDVCSSDLLSLSCSCTTAKTEEPESAGAAMDCGAPASPTREGESGHAIALEPSSPCGGRGALGKRPCHLGNSAQEEYNANGTGDGMKKRERPMKYFKLIRSGIDVVPLLEEVRSREQAWL